ncbi:MAG TPA: DUF2339 domain-containing protein [Verrucomicrobiae bacterium]
MEELSRRLETMELELSELKWMRETPRPAEAAPAPKIQTIMRPVAPPEPRPSPPPPSAPAVTPPPIAKTAPMFIPPVPKDVVLKPAISTPPKPAVDWEKFMGVKGLAWVSGFTFFLGIIFAIQYAFGHHLVPPWMQAALGFLAGLGVLAGGMVMSRKNYPALSQTLCATGVLIFYSVTFACRAYYHFAFFGAVPAFLLMALVTAAAFSLAVRFNAMVVAILGMLGGFLTPVLLSTGQDSPLVLFGYIAILDTGLILVALRRRWLFLAALAAFGTAMMQIGWAARFFIVEKYFEGNKILIALGVLLLFNALYLAACLWAKARKAAGPREWLFGSALGLAAVALAFTAWFLDFKSLAERPGLIFSFVMLVDFGVLALTVAEETLAVAQPVAGLAVFALLGYWTERWLRQEFLFTALAFYFVFAVIHAALPFYFQKRRGQKSGSSIIHIFPLLPLLLVLMPILRLAQVSFIVWPFILLVDILAIALAVLTAALLPVLAALLLTLFAAGELVLKIPSNLSGLPESLFVIAAFAVFFVAASLWLARRFKPSPLKDAGMAAPEKVMAVLPGCAAVLPFLLLMMVVARLPLWNPAPVFAAALLLVVLLLGMARLLTLEWLPAIGVACVAGLECFWHVNYFGNLHVPNNLVLAWYLIFLAAFAAFPFLFMGRFPGKTVPWAAAAMAGPIQFFLIHHWMKVIHPNHFMGLLPAAFAVPELLSLAAVRKKIPAEQKSRMARLAWFGGVALFFITIIFPIQFDRQWITIGWALEGAALLWLFHRVPHPGLRLAGIGLLAAAFARLALDPAVLAYHPRSATPIFNWYLYAYGIVIAALFAGAKLLAPPRNLVYQSNVPPILAALGTALAFLLLNIEIADYFSAPGLTLTFEFSGNFARDMSYSIAWALFALGLLVAGIAKKARAARFTAIALLCVTLLKLFLHDLAQLDQLYRIGAFIGVAVIAMLASFAYQKLFSIASKET